MDKTKLLRYADMEDLCDGSPESMATIQVNAMLVAIEACGAMLNEYQCNCSVDVAAITPDSIRAEQEKADADQGRS